MNRFGLFVMLILFPVMWPGSFCLAQSKAKPRAKKQVSASEKAKLEQKKKQLINDIAATGKLLKETEKNKEAALQRAILLNTKIQQRNQLINSYRDELALLDMQISSNKAELSRLEARLAALKENYARMVFSAYKNRGDSDQLLYLLAAENVNNAYRRLNYFRQVARFRKVSVEKINGVREEISASTAELEAVKNQKNMLLAAETEQKKIMESEKAEAESLAQKLKGKEKELRTKIEKAERERAALEVKIKKIIEAEIEAERRRAEAKARSEAEKKKKAAETGKSAASAKPTAETKTAEKPLVMNVTPETRALSNSFEGNKGALPWPVERGVITGNFGSHPHPVLKNITVKNDGIDITAPAGSEARAVFGGVVSGVFPVDGFGNVVIIRHGEYLTVYSNLAQVSVSRDQKVSAKQKLGTIETSENGKAVMNFQIRKGAAVLNPAGWLAR